GNRGDRRRVHVLRIAVSSKPMSAGIVGDENVPDAGRGGESGNAQKRDRRIEGTDGDPGRLAIGWAEWKIDRDIGPCAAVGMRIVDLHVCLRGLKNPEWSCRRGFEGLGRERVCDVMHGGRKLEILDRARSVGTLPGEILFGLARPGESRVGRYVHRMRAEKDAPRDQRIDRKRWKETRARV